MLRHTVLSALPRMFAGFDQPLAVSGPVSTCLDFQHVFSEITAAVRPAEVVSKVRVNLPLYMAGSELDCGGTWRCGLADSVSRLKYLDAGLSLGLANPRKGKRGWTGLLLSLLT